MAPVTRQEVFLKFLGFVLQLKIARNSEWRTPSRVHVPGDVLRQLGWICWVKLHIEGESADGTLEKKRQRLEKGRGEKSQEICW